jgi:hypothetical protein
MKIRILFLSIIFVLFSSLGNAKMITYQFNGTVTSTNTGSTTIQEVDVGDTVTGEFTYDTQGSDSMPSDPKSGLYPSESFSLTVKGYSFDASDNNISVTNDSVLIEGSPPVDAFEVVSPLREVAGSSLSGLPPAQMDLVMIDSDATVFSNDALPASLNIDDFEIVSEVPYGTTGGRLIFQSLSNGQTGEIRFQIDALVIGATVQDSFKVYIPHITGGDGNWSDYLQVNNIGPSTAPYTVILYDSGGQVAYDGSFSIDSLDQQQIDLKSLFASAQMGLVTYNDATLAFRLSQENVSGGGIAEFVLNDTLSSSLTFFFSDFSPLIEWKGLAISNQGSTTVSVDLTIIGNASEQGIAQVSIPPHSRIFGLYQKWFPGVDFYDAQAIKAVSTSAVLTGETISGTADGERLLFGIGIPTQ